MSSNAPKQLQLFNSNVDTDVAGLNGYYLILWFMAFQGQEKREAEMGWLIFVVALRKKKESRIRKVTKGSFCG